MNDLQKIPPSNIALSEALELSEEILKNVEFNDIPLKNIALKASRLARILNDSDYQLIFAYEASGYPTTPDGVTPEVWRLGLLAGRRHQEKESNLNNIKETMDIESIEAMEKRLQLTDIGLAAARDPDISISSANPNQFVTPSIGNTQERLSIQQVAGTYAEKLAKSRNLIYQYTIWRYYELKLSGIADHIFTRTRQKVDRQIGILLPDSVKKFTSIYDNLQSENPEDWANAVHSCRRILLDFADNIYPPKDDEQISVRGKKKTIKLGRDQYVNRIIAYVMKKSKSERFKEIVGSNLSYLGDRLDSVSKATQKGTHSEIVTREEADRYVIYTYLLIGDVLSL